MPGSCVPITHAAARARALPRGVVVTAACAARVRAGNAKTLMLVNVSPAEGSSDETQSSLQYATRVRAIKVCACTCTGASV